ncbi:MAG: glycosyltransferase [Bryobacteraceae bacterium]|jgi:GT2 family glycosyltransferase/glycosyltransferase involved in cell wall biosynthesis
MKSVLLLIVSPLMWLGAVLWLALTDLAWLLWGRRDPPHDEPCRTDAASVVIPNWNGRDLLAQYLPSVVAALAANPDNEIIVVDNGSEDDSAAFVRQMFPGVRVVALERNLGFGGGSNAGFRAAKHDIVVLLNSDMRVAPDFLAPLLESFRDAGVFAVSCQIFFRDPARVREETGLTQGWWQDGGLKVRHRVDAAITDLFPCFYGGGGSCAFDRRKFLELGGFDELLAPFYLEDTDLGYLAWKRGWKVLYQPRSMVYHEHRGTIGKRFSEARIQAVLKKNYLLFCWKNIHDWRRLAEHFCFSYGGALASLAAGDVPGRANLDGWWRAFRQLRGAGRSRWRARELAVVCDTEAFQRPLGGFYWDRFGDEVQAGKVLFVSPYPICPPVHGGGVFMYQTLRELTKHCEVHVVAMLDLPSQAAAQEELREFCASAEFLARPPLHGNSLGSIAPHAVREFANGDFDWLIHRQMYLKKIGVVQLEYTPLAQYAPGYRRIPVILFEHDIYFQSIARGLEYMHGALARSKARYEYLRALRYELRMLPRCDRVQVCTRENAEYLAGFLPHIRGRMDAGLRAGIDTARYQFAPGGREPYTMLFLGSFRHEPNIVALEWFVNRVLPRIVERRPETRLVVVGSDAPARHPYEDRAGIEIRGFVEDIREPLGRYAVFVCPVLSGSGVRVKLLEAFAAGMPVVSTRVGAEGLAREDGEFCLLADEPGAFAERVLQVFENPAMAAELAARARAEVAAQWDMALITARLAESYRAAVREKNATSSSA